MSYAGSARPSATAASCNVCGKAPRDGEVTTLPGAVSARLDDLPLMLTVEEAAGVLRIGRNSAYAAVAEGSLPAVRIGNRIRIPRAGLATLVEHGCELADSARGAAARGEE